jgi:WhiB family redox-sensing transcriptional regulator
MGFSMNRRSRGWSSLWGSRRRDALDSHGMLSGWSRFGGYRATDLSWRVHALPGALHRGRRPVRVIMSTWRERAACRGADPNIFFPARGVQGIEDARAYCARCSVTTECLAVAMSDATAGRVGVWGGTSERERRLIRRGATGSDGETTRRPGPPSGREARIPA